MCAPLRSRRVLVAVSLCLTACVEGIAAPWPAAPVEAESAIWVRRCADEVQVWAFELPARPPPFVENCELDLTYWLAYLPGSLASYRLRPGLLETKGCEQSALTCCRPAELPEALPGQIYESRRSEGDSAFFPTSEPLDPAWPSEFSDVRVNRGCSCPRALPQVLNRPAVGYRRVRFAPLAGEELLVLAVGPLATQSDLFLTTVSKLETEGFPGESERFAEIVGSLPSSVVALPDGRYFLGQEAWVNTSTSSRSIPGPLLHGRVGQAPVPVPFADAEDRRETRLIALRPGTEDEPELAALALTRPFELLSLRGNTWTSFGDASSMSGVCRGPLDTQEQALVWRDEHEVLAMPGSARKEWRMGEHDDQVNTPDGLWRMRDGVIRWERPPRPESECWSGLYQTETWGPLLATHRPRLLRLGNAGWEDFIPPERFPQIRFDGELQYLLETDGFILYTRATGLVGLLSEEDHCFEAQRTMGRLRQLIRVGGKIVGAEDAPSGTGHAAMVLIDPP